MYTLLSLLAVALPASPQDVTTGALEQSHFCFDVDSLRSHKGATVTVVFQALAPAVLGCWWILGVYICENVAYVLVVYIFVFTVC